jgi:hypothetical protein
MVMQNWSVDTQKLSKYPKDYTVWKLEQLINYGLNDEKLNLDELLLYFNELTIDPQKKTYLKFLLAND